MFDAKNIYWFEKLASALLECCGFSVVVKSLVLQWLTSEEAAIHKKYQFQERVTEIVIK